MKTSTKKLKINRCLSKPSTLLFANKKSSLVTAIAVALMIPSFSVFADVEEEQEEVERISITGSRLLSISAESPSPVTVIGKDLIKASGATDIADLLNKLPSMAPGLAGNTSNYNGNAGMSSQDLRGQGAKRTLTLINGRRHVGSIPGESTVDMSTIPAALIERIEILTGGASSIYGADAVAGVVNIIMTKDFEGTQLNISGGTSDRGDGNKHGFSLTHGLNFNNGKGNTTFYVSYDEVDEISAKDRPYTNSNWEYIDNPANTELKNQLRAQGLTAEEITEYINNDDIPNFLIGQRYSVTASPTSVVYLGGVAYTFNADGSMRPVRLGESGELFDKDQGLTGVRTDAGGEQLGSYDYQRLRVPVEKLIFNNTLNYEFDNELYFSMDTKYTRAKSESRVFPNSVYGSTLLSADNAFISDELSTLMVEDGVTDLPFGRHFVEMGLSGSDFKRELFQVVASLEGEFANGWSWEFYGQYGKSTSDDTTVNDFYEDRWQASLDSVKDENGNAVCRASIEETWYAREGENYSNCIPHNVFQPMSDELVDYLKVDHTSSQSQTQRVMHFNTSGELIENWAGMIYFSTGLEYRKETSETSPSPIYREGLGGWNTLSRPVIGNYDVKEAFFETNIPLLSDVFLAESLEVSLSGRVSSYSEAGTNTSWNIGSVWKPTDDVMVRVSRSKSARAPNINEQFTTESEGFAWLYQPCSQNQIKTAEAIVVENCKKMGVNVFVNEEGETTSDMRWYQPGNVVSSGNKELDVETANTLTAGIVITPTAIENFEITFDYWDIKLSNMIDSFNVGTIVASCPEQESLDNQFCNLLTRQDNGVITDVALKTLNLNERRTRGLDIIMNYSFDVFGGEVAINSITQKLIARDIQTDPTLDLVSTVGLYGSPEWKSSLNLSYDYQGSRLGISTRFIGKQKSRLTNTPSIMTHHETPTMLYTDVNFSYKIDDNLSLNVGVDNLFDKKTPQMPNAYSGGANYYLGSSGGLFDTFGRMYFGSVSYEF
ncbi:MAG: TonB-dependent receptor [Colwellia sp.]|nr:TonB-dependent receptor [Colwellia sp.]